MLAISTMASSSSTVSCWAPSVVPSDITPPVAMHLRKSAPVSYTHLDVYKRQVQCLDYQSGVEEPEVVDPSEALRLLNRYAQEHIEPAAALRKRLDTKSCLELFFEIRDQGKLARCV